MKRRIASNVFVEQLNIPFSGKLIIDKGESPWGKLVIGDEIRNSIFKSMPNDGNYELPDYEAHVSVFDEEEVKEYFMDKTLLEEGKEFTFYMCNLAYCNPESWDEVEKLYMVQVYSPELEALRKKYNLTSKMHNNEHEFHITICTKMAKVANKVANQYECELISGALYDFLGYLTTTENLLTDGPKQDCTKALDALEEWSNSKNFWKVYF